MKAFLGFVLGIITVGVFLIAYGVLSPRVNAAPPWAVAPMNGVGGYQVARPMLASEQVDLGYGYTDRIVTRSQPAVVYEPAPPRRVPVAYRSDPSPVPRRVDTARSIERSNGRNWKKTAMIVGGTTAAGAGVGAIFGGKKGALIGAAIGGGASSIYEARKRN